MPGIGNTYLQLIDSMKGADDSTFYVVEALRKLNPVMFDANVITCNSGTKHKHAIRTGLPSVSWGSLYKGIPQSKSTMMQVEDTTGFIEGLSSIDTRLLELAKNPEAIRMGEARSYLEAMAQEFNENFFYSDVNLNPNRFHGMAARYNSLELDNVIDGGGAGSDNTSIWFVTWGDHATSLITPEGIAAGVQRQDKGEQRVTDGNGEAYYVKEELFRHHAGVAVKDWRYNARVCNIDVSEAKAGNISVYDLMVSAYYALEGRRKYEVSDNLDSMISDSRTVIYMNRTMLEVLDNESRNKGSSDNFVRLSPMQVQGEEVLSFRGIPIRDTDHILNTEALVS